MTTNPPVTVLSTIYQAGFDGSGKKSLQMGRRLRLGDALEKTYSTDAHFAVYYAESEAFIPRLNKTGLEAAQRKFGNIVCGAVAVDVDAPKHVKQGGHISIDEWWKDQESLIGALPISPAYYRTRGGYRLVWVLKRPLPPDEFEAALSRVHYWLTERGILVDRACKDWTRVYRLPYVLRNGKHERYPADFFSGETLDPATLPEPPPADFIKRATFDPTTHPSGGVHGLVAVFQSAGLYVRPLPGGKHACRCPWEHEHSSPYRGPGDTSTALLPAQLVGLDGKRQSLEEFFFHCHHGHCIGRSGTRRIKKWFQEHHPGLWEQYCEPQWSELATMLREKAQDQTPSMSIEDIRAALKDALGGPHPVAAIRAPLGAGKTQAVIDYLANLANDSDDRVIAVALPTHDLRDEFYLRLISRLGPVRKIHVEKVRGREAGNCDYHYEVNSIRRPAGGDAVTEYCRNCPEYQRCNFFRALFARKPQPGVVIKVGTHAALLDADIAKHEETPDLIIIDESPRAALDPEYAITATDIEWASNNGSLILGPDDKTRLLKLIEATRDNRKLYQGVSGAVLGRVIKSRPLCDPDKAVEAARWVIETAPPGRVADVAEALPSYVALKALADRWPDYTGCYARHGRLHMRPERGPAPAAGRVRYLDATSSHQLAGALCGADTQWIDLGYGLRTDSKVYLTLVRRNGGRSAIEENPKVAYAVHRHWDSETTLHVTHKALVDEPSRLGDWQWHTEDLEGRVVHHNGTKVFGLNQFSDCTTIVLEDWHVPLATVSAQAEALREACPEMGDGLTEARQELRLRPLIQAIGRLRPGPDREIHVVWITREDDLPPGLVPSVVCTGNEVLYQQTGIIFGQSGLLAALRDALGERPLVTLRDLASQVEQAQENRRCNSPLPETLKTLLSESPAFGVAGDNVLKRLRDHWGSDWAQLAQDLDRVCIPVTRVEGGESKTTYTDQVLATPGAIPLRQVYDVCVTPTTQWLGFLGERIAGPQNDYLRAAKAIEGAGQVVDDQALALKLGTTANAVRVYLSRWSITLDRLRAHGSQVFPAPPEADTLVMLRVGDPVSGEEPREPEWACEAIWPDEDGARAPP